MLNDVCFCLVSGNNPRNIGTVAGRLSTTVTWLIKFDQEGTFNLQVRVFGYDSDGKYCEASTSTSITIRNEEANASSSANLDKLLLTFATLVVVVVIVLLLSRKVKSNQNLNM